MEGGLRSWFAQVRHVDYPRTLLALCIGVAGAVVFLWIEAPMPWMLGPLAGCLIASLLGVPLAAPTAFRSPMAAMIGVMLGSGYGPQLLDYVFNWWATIAGLLAFMLVAGMICVAYFRLVARYDFPTAYFAGMPGGVVEMVLLGENSGADLRRVALVHAGRIVFTVFSIPFIVQWVEGGQIVRSAAASVSLLDMHAGSLFWLLTTFSGGLMLGRLINLPARYLLGPLIVSVAVHMSGLSTFKPPWELVAVAQLVLGSVIGCRFAGSRTRDILQIFLVSLGSCFLMILLSCAFAFGVSHLTQYTLTELLLAYSPGGLAEMGVLALALQLDVALVSTHHVLRIFLVVIGARALMPLFGIKK
ncbi:AbrB family transcriptional regulator [Nitratireductor kimnyeongensis]|uniref:AbrB family transcriptional regulator n=1 Tax=Nitratireductor kimnyeongensis TaxID=430679 RepID=A0ABW0T4A3_9HYPH|nr:AbrB family transcriptional regulator [Nitratireductor kimnyeongensis]QZZ34806.1 AbrB family transcriptional regulator [Nitratireductor kimnyeongensis]